MDISTKLKVCTLQLRVLDDDLKMKENVTRMAEAKVTNFPFRFGNPVGKKPFRRPKRRME
jgi:hypothetical protein